MDFSKLPDGQRQQLEQLQKQFQEHQAQQQKQQESASAAAAAAAAASQQPPPAYDPSQLHQSYDPSQAYDQSYYYNYNHNHSHNHQDPSQQHQQYDASYYQNYYPNAYQQPQYTHPETSAATAYTMPSEQQRNEGAGSGSSGLGHLQGQDPRHDPGNQVNLGGTGTQPNPGYPVPPGLNAAAAAAVAALSQLTQFAGSMGAAERAMGGGGYGPPMAGGGHYGQGHFRPPAGHSPYRGGGRRGGGQFRGGGRGNFGFRPPSTAGSGPPFHGRGRGRGRGSGSGRGGRGRGGRHGQSFGASSPHPETSAVKDAKPSGAESSAQANVQQQPVRIAWCELCRVDCTSKEILEQHKIGKRHKKNEQKLQDMKGAYQPAVETQKDENPSSGITSQVQNSVQELETDNLMKVGTDDNKVETGENNDQEKKPWMKRKMRGGGRGGGRGAKRQRQGAMGPPKPKIVIPLMCDLCNVKCDTQEVFDRHVAGKKHIAKLKRFEGHQAIYGPTAVQALYPPNPLSQTISPQPAYSGAPSSYPEAYIPPHQTQNPNPQLADAPLEFGTQKVVSEPQAAQVSTAETHAGNGAQ